MDNLRVIPTMIHGIADYLGGLLLLFAPNIFGFSEADPAAVLIPRVLGVAFIGMALLTRYEVGVFKVIPMRTHLMVDYVASIFLAVSPWLFGFADEPNNVWLPHVIVGAGYLIVSLLTKTTPENEATSTTSRSY